MTLDPSLLVALCGAIESVINKALLFDPGSRYALAKLEGKVLAVELVRPQLTVYVFPEEKGVRLQSTYDGSVTTRVKGTPLALLSLINSPRVNLADSGVEVFGSTGFLIELQKIAQNLDIDWEDALSHVTGNITGHQFALGVAGVKQWFGERKQSFERLFGEFLTEEIQATPNRNELESYYQQIDTLRLAVDRATAQVQQLKNERNSTINKSTNDNNTSCDKGSAQ